MTKISIIIPAWREGEKLLELTSAFAALDGVEVIVALAGEDDTTEEPGEGVLVVKSDKGRANQMNAGAKIATGENLLFLHADTKIDPATLEEVRKTLSNKSVAGGAYRLRIGGGGMLLKLVSTMANLRSQLFKLPYGDQAIFMRREVFERLGGYPDVLLLEDVMLVDKIKRAGRVVIIPCYAETSPRRWEKEGVFTVTAKNLAIIIAYRLGVSPGRLAGWY